MKQTTYNCLTKTVTYSDHFVGENDASKIVIDFTGVGVDAYSKWLDIRIDGGDKQPYLLGTTIIAEFSVPVEVLQYAGRIEIQPYAISGDTIVRFPIKPLPINESIMGVDGGISYDPSALEGIQGAISDLDLRLDDAEADILSHVHDDRYYTETELNSGQLDNRYYTESEATEFLATKVDKILGKGLSTEDYSTAEKSKLAGIEVGAEVNNMSDVNVTDLTDGGDTTLHTHDGRYYTETEMNDLLAGKSDSSHLHDNRYYTETESDAVTNALDGRIDVLENVVDLTGEPTGFTNNENITVTYNPTTRKITLTGTFEAYYKGDKVTALVSGWESPAHADVQTNYYLYYCETGFVFSTTPWDFSCLMIAFVQYNSHQLGIREVHGFMPATTHDEFHRTIGAYKKSGGDFTGVTLNSTTVAQRRPDISDTYVADEDLTSLISSLSTKLYTQRFLAGNAVRSFTVDQADILPLSGNQPYYNQNNAGTWQQTLFNNNSYGAIFVVALPTTSDTLSKKYRYMFVQPQQISTTLATIQALTPSSLVHGDSTLLVSEFVFIGKIIVRYTGSNWSITQIDKLDGTRISQVATPAGNYLSVVSHDSTLTGEGTAGSPLVVANDGHTHDGRYYTEAEVDTKDALKADKLMATNLVTNGDFSNGTTGWGTYGSTLSALNNTLSVIGSGSNATPWTDVPETMANLSPNSKIYLRMKARVTNSVATDIMLFSSTPILVYPIQINNPIIDNWYTRSTIHNVVAGGNFNMKIRHGYADSATANGKVMEVQYVLAIDLTAIFGAGLEPSKEQIDRLLSIYPNSWFNGTSELTNVKQLWNEKTDRILATNLVTNGDFSNGTTGWVVTNGGVFEVVAGKLVATITNVATTRKGNLLTILNGHKYYVYVESLSQTNLNDTVTLTTRTSNLATNIQTIDNLTGRLPLSKYSIVFTATGNAECVAFNCGVAISPATITTGRFSVLDLTAIFGAGKEPTAVQMDNLLANFPNSWFNGTVELASLINILNTKADKTQEAWITPTLLNGATEVDPIRYRKNSFGIVEFKGRINFPALNTIAIVVPPGYRPLANTQWLAPSSSVVATLEISNAGNLRQYTGTLTSVSLAGLRYVAEA